MTADFYVFAGGTCVRSVQVSEIVADRLHRLKQFDPNGYSVCLTIIEAIFKHSIDLIMDENGKAFVPSQFASWWGEVRGTPLSVCYHAVEMTVEQPEDCSSVIRVTSLKIDRV